jgi:hypothetical protein
MLIPKEELLTQLGTAITNEVVTRLRRLGHVPHARLEELSRACHD